MAAEQDVKLAAIREAADGLTYPSESDEPFDAFVWPATSGSAREQITARAGKDRKVTEVAVDRFFSELEAADEAYRALRQALESNLAGLQIFRAGDGEVRVDVYLIGRTRSGEWAGLHTVSVET